MPLGLGRGTGNGTSMKGSETQRPGARGIPEGGRILDIAVLSASTCSVYLVHESCRVVEFARNTVGILF